MDKHPDGSGTAACMAECAPDLTRLKHMSEPVRAAIRDMQKTLSRRQDTVMAFVTGSQADGTATPQSDLDIYHVVNGGWWGRRRDAAGTTAAGITVDVMVDLAEHACKNASLYGSYECRAMRAGILIWENQNAEGWRAVRDAMDHDLYLPDCTERWLEIARSDIDACELGDGAAGASASCMVYAKSIQASLMAALTHDGVRFGFTRRLADMACMLRDPSIMRMRELDMADTWLRAGLSGKLAAKDQDEAARMARSIYGVVDKYTDGRRRPQHRPLR